MLPLDLPRVPSGLLPVIYTYKSYKYVSLLYILIMGVTICTCNNAKAVHMDNQKRKKENVGSTSWHIDTKKYFMQRLNVRTNEKDVTYNHYTRYHLYWHTRLYYFFFLFVLFLMNDNSLFRERERGFGSSPSFETKTQERREEIVRSSSQMQKLAQRTRLLAKTITCLGIKTKSQQTFRVFCTLYVNVLIKLINSFAHPSQKKKNMIEFSHQFF